MNAAIEGDIPLTAAVDDRLERIVGEHHRSLTALATLLCGNAAMADDIVADAYTNVLANRRRAQIDDLLPYLRRAVVNGVTARHRRRVIETRVAASQRIDWRTDSAGATPSAEALVLERGELHAALLRLPTEQRAVVVLRHVFDLAEADVADALGIRLGTVKSRLARGLAAMRQTLDPTGARP